MNIAQGYKKFENAEEDPDKKNVLKSNSLKNSNHAPDGSTAINFTQPILDVAKRENKKLRIWKSLRILAAIGLLLSLSLILLETFEDVIIAKDEDAENFGVCGVGTGIWAGFLGVLAGVLGVCSFRLMNVNKSLILAYFVVLITATVADGILIILTAFCMDALPYVRISHRWDQDNNQIVVVTRSPFIIPIDQLLYAGGTILLFIGFAHLLTGIFSAILICRGYWCTDKDRLIVIYRQQQEIDNLSLPVNVVSDKKAFIESSPKQASHHVPGPNHAYENTISE